MCLWVLIDLALSDSSAGPLGVLLYATYNLPSVSEIFLTGFNLPTWLCLVLLLIPILNPKWLTLLLATAR